MKFMFSAPQLWLSALWLLVPGEFLLQSLVSHVKLTLYRVSQKIVCLASRGV